MPRLAKTLSVLEERFLALCETSGIALPEVNERISGLRVDTLWRDERLIAELDGYAAHGSRTAIERDRGRELRLRAAGYVILRYATGHRTTPAGGRRPPRGARRTQTVRVCPRHPG